MLLNRGDVLATWPVVYVDALTTEEVAGVVTGGRLVFAQRATSEALRHLRDAKVSYATAAEAV